MIFLFFIVLVLLTTIYLCHQSLSKLIYYESKSNVHLENEHFIPISFIKLSKLLSTSFENKEEQKLFEKFENILNLIFQYKYNSKFNNLEQMYEKYYNPSVNSSNGKIKKFDC